MAKISKLALYDMVIGELFTILRKKSPALDVLDFEKQHIEELVQKLFRSKKLPKLIKNIPDIKYTYDARKDFPNRIARHGYWAIIGRGKSKYSFGRIDRNNLIRIPKDISAIPRAVKVNDLTPALVAKVLGHDEQAILTRARYNNIVGHFLGMQVYQVQGHERTTVSYGQIEVDEVYVGEGPGGDYVIPISAKGGGRDCLSFTQALNLNAYASEKPRYKDLKRKPLGITRGPEGQIWLVEFNTELELRRIEIVRVGIYSFG